MAIDSVGGRHAEGLFGDLRIRVIGAVEGGCRRGAVAAAGVGESTATAWVGRWRRTGSSEAKSQKGRSRSPLAAHAPWLLALIAAEADLTLEEIGERLAARGIQVGQFDLVVLRSARHQL